MSLSVRPTGYDLLGHFDITNELTQVAPPYLPKDPHTYKFNPHEPHGHRLRAFDGELPPDASPDHARLSGFDLAESIWSQESDLTLDDLALDSDTGSGKSSTSSHWSAPPLTPSTSRHLELQPPPESAANPLESTPFAVATTTQEAEVEEPDSPAPAYFRDPLEPDPALLASLDPQLRLRPFEAFEDMCWACFSDSAPAEVARSLHPRSVSPSLNLPASTSCSSFTIHSTFSEASMATVHASPLPPFSPIRPPSPSAPPPAYPASKPLPSLPPHPPSSFRRPAEHTQLRPSLPPSSPVVMAFKSPLADLSSPTVPSSDSVHFFPVPAPVQVRPRSKSVGGTRTVRRLTSAISRLRKRE
ncbi:hypothetical protein BJV74DRAFT_815613 [Russula compacta]|nr:hypothetical protein BJV74DRAFT_815613 [Russula compacta]